MTTGSAADRAGHPDHVQVIRLAAGHRDGLMKGKGNIPFHHVRPLIGRGYMDIISNAYCGECAQYNYGGYYARPYYKVDTDAIIITASYEL